MNNSVARKIENKINQLPSNSCFIVSDFITLGAYETIKKTMTRLEKNKKIRRILRGVYDKPKYNPLIQDYVLPNIEEVAKAIARANNWVICPTGNTALNYLGLSTQVPANSSFLTTGPNKKYKVNDIEITFLHRSDKEMNGFSYKTKLVIQSIKQIGKNNITKDVISKISKQLSNKEKDVLITEGNKSLLWVYEIIKKICKGDNICSN